MVVVDGKVRLVVEVVRMIVLMLLVVSFVFFKVVCVVLVVKFDVVLFLVVKWWCLMLDWFLIYLLDVFRVFLNLVLGMICLGR